MAASPSSAAQRLMRPARQPNSHRRCPFRRHMPRDPKESGDSRTGFEELRFENSYG